MTRKRRNQPRQRRYDRLAVLAFIASYKEQNGGRSPSQRRIQRNFDISAPSVVHTMLHRFERNGLLTITTYGRGHAADLALTEAGQEAVVKWQANNRANNTPSTEQP